MEHCPTIPTKFMVAFVMIVFVSVVVDTRITGTARDQFSDCVGEQIQIARQNWDTVAPTSENDAEFVAQDQLRDFITEVCYGDQ